MNLKKVIESLNSSYSSIHLLDYYTGDFICRLNSKRFNSHYEKIEVQQYQLQLSLDTLNVYVFRNSYNLIKNIIRHNESVIDELRGLIL